MKLKKISLRNYRQHENLDVEFQGSMIMICGRNGSGKSNFIGAVQFALTGEQPGFDKGDLLNWGAAQRGEGGYVDLEFEHNGMECRIQRRIERPAVTLKIGADTYTGVKKVQEAMESVLGIDKDVLRQSVFVRQTEVESVLFTDPRERELAFQRLIGLGDAAKHQKFLTDFLSAMAEPRSMVEEIARQKELVANQKADLKRLRDSLAEISAKLEEAGDEAETQKMIKLCQQRKSLVGAAIDAFDTHEACVANFNNITTMYGEIAGREVEDLKPLMDEVSGLQEAVRHAQDAMDANATRRQAAQFLESARRDLDAIPDDFEKQVAELDDVNTRVNELRGKVQQLDKLLKEAPDGNVCPLCGSTTDHNIRAEIQAERDATVKEGRELSDWLAKHMHIKDYPAAFERAKANVDRWEQRVSELGPMEPEENVDELLGRLSDAKVRLSKVQSSNVSVSQARLEIEHAKKSMLDASSKYGEALSKLPHQVDGRDMLVKVASGLDSSVEGLFNVLNTLSQLKAQKAQFEGGIAQVEKSVREAEDGIAELERMDLENKAKADKLKTVRDVKDWFSYKNGPRVMSQSIMALLVDETNRYLENFGSEFTVIPMEEGMGFRYVYNDGRPVSSPAPEATMLSGGQKIALAVAFRFAVYSMFANKLGLLSLDEPTAYLDDETIGRFADVLSKIRQLAANMGLQVIVSTHEAAISPAFDQTISIGR